VFSVADCHESIRQCSCLAAACGSLTGGVHTPTSHRLPLQLAARAVLCGSALCMRAFVPRSAVRPTHCALATPLCSLVLSARNGWWSLTVVLTVHTCVWRTAGGAQAALYSARASGEARQEGQTAALRNAFCSGRTCRASVVRLLGLDFIDCTWDLCLVSFARHMATRRGPVKRRRRNGDASVSCRSRNQQPRKGPRRPRPAPERHCLITF
jgi:hypothetical protein